MYRNTIYRFIERDYWANKVAAEQPHLNQEQLSGFLDEISQEWHDLTFKFREDGSVAISDNDTGASLVPSELRGACYDFYVRKRIEQIKSYLAPEEHLQSA
jgi:hypothetical protein